MIDRSWHIRMERGLVRPGGPDGYLFRHNRLKTTIHLMEILDKRVDRLLDLFASIGLMQQPSSTSENLA